MRTAQRITRQVLHWLRRGGRRLHHNSVTLLVLLVLGLGEPLICIIHCDVWMPLMASAMLHASAQPHQGHHAHQHASPHHSGRTQAAVVQAVPAPMASQAGMHCTMRPGDSGPSPLVPLSPLHDLLLVAVALFGVLLLQTSLRRHDLAPPNTCAHPPPLPPPLVA